MHLLFVLLWVLGTIQPSQPPLLQGAWIDQRTLVVTWEAPGWRCLYLIGGALPDTVIPQSCQMDSGGVAFTDGGVDHLYTPVGRSAVVLRGVGFTDMVLPIPPAPLGYHRYFPMMMR